MNETSSPVVMGILFVLRCLIPLGILLGVSYLLRRWELVVEHADEAAEAAAMELQEAAETAAPEPAPAPKVPAKPKKKADGKKKPAASKKKKEA